MSDPANDDLRFVTTIDDQFAVVLGMRKNMIGASRLAGQYLDTMERATCFAQRHAALIAHRTAMEELHAAGEDYRSAVSLYDLMLRHGDFNHG